MFNFCFISCREINDVCCSCTRNLCSNDGTDCFLNLYICISSLRLNDVNILLCRLQESLTLDTIDIHFIDYLDICCENVYSKPKMTNNENKKDKFTYI